ncbi:hypothetical protein PGB90_001752 [Kerria lacca]
MTNRKESITLNELFATLVASGTFFYSGFNLGFTTEYIEELNTNKTTFNDPDGDSWIGKTLRLHFLLRLNPRSNSIQFSGGSGLLLSFIGCLIQGYLADKFGRKILLYLTYILHFVGWLTISQTSYIIGGRIVISIACGIGFSNTIYTVEILRSDYRGAFLLLNSASDNLGLLFLYIIEYFVSSKTVSLILSIFALVLFVGVFYIPETPYWYMLKNRRENAIKAVTWLREMDKELVEVEVRLIEQNLDNNEKSPSFLQTIFTLKWWKYFLFFSIYLTLIEFTGFDIIFTIPTDSIVAYNLPWTMVSENLPTELRATVFAALCAETSRITKQENQKEKRNKT